MRNRLQSFTDRSLILYNRLQPSTIVYNRLQCVARTQARTRPGAGWRKTL